MMTSGRVEMVMGTLRTLVLACVAAWVGIMAFFSFVAAPGLFRTLERREAGDLVAALLPAYYQWGIALSGLAVGALVVLAARRGVERLRHLAGAALGAVMVIGLVWALAVSLPDANRARRAGDDVAFAATPRQAVRLNLLVLVCGVAIGVLEAWPGSSGKGTRRPPPGR
jgi:4-amino-4-deoxy-L-arabinose transferase-like glycosyltransferase